MISSKQNIDVDGFAVIPDLICNSEIERLETELERTPLRRSRAGARHALSCSSIAKFSTHPKLLEIAGQVLGSEMRPFRATLFDKSPISNWLVVWHQDTALPLRERHDQQGWGPWSVKEGVVYAHAPAKALEHVLALRVHLDDSMEKNGPLRVLPGTHKLGVLSDDAIEQLVSRIAAVNCLVAKGGVIVMRPLIVHASSKSQVQSPRRVLHIEYASSLSVADNLELALA